MATARKTSSARKSTGATKARRGASVKKHGAAKSKMRQHYSELGAKKAPASAKGRMAASAKAAPARSRKAKPKARVKAKSEIVPATRELFSDLAKVGRKIKRRVKRAL